MCNNLRLHIAAEERKSLFYLEPVSQSSTLSG
jgi:hypothetical protein